MVFCFGNYFLFKFTLTGCAKQGKRQSTCFENASMLYICIFFRKNSFLDMIIFFFHTVSFLMMYDDQPQEANLSMELKGTWGYNGMPLKPSRVAADRQSVIETLVLSKFKN